MLWELEPRVLDKCAMPLQAYRLRPTRLGIQTNKPGPQAALDNDAGRQTSKSTRFFAPSVVALPHVNVVNYNYARQV